MNATNLSTETLTLTQLIEKRNYWFTKMENLQVNGDWVNNFQSCSDQEDIINEITSQLTETITFLEKEIDKDRDYDLNFWC